MEKKIYTKPTIQTMQVELVSFIAASVLNVGNEVVDGNAALSKEFDFTDDYILLESYENEENGY